MISDEERSAILEIGKQLISQSEDVAARTLLVSQSSPHLFSMSLATFRCRIDWIITSYGIITNKAVIN